jgi:hypothetical protein
MQGHLDEDLHEPLVEAPDRNTGSNQNRQPSARTEETSVPTTINVPYAASNKRPYIIPQYDPTNSFSGHETTASTSWPRKTNENLGISAAAARLDIWVSGAYTIVAALTIMQGFGIMLHFSITSG